VKQDPYARYRRWEPLMPIGRVVVGLLVTCGIVALIQAVQVATALSEGTGITGALDQTGGQIQDQVAPAPLGPVVSLLALGTGILWLIWQHRAQRNLYARGVPDLRYTPGWAVGWWFVPVASLVLPYLCMRELFGCAGMLAAPGIPLERRPDWRVPAWWIAYVGSSILLVVALVPLLSAVITSIGDQVETNPGHVVVTITAGAIHSARIWAIVADLVKVVAAALAAWVVWTISTREDVVARPEAVSPPWPGALTGPTPPVPPRPDLG
jgi:Domain of unknown function (DUF4328)